jgi:hypothetical protein
VKIHGIIAGVDLTAAEPAIKGFIAVIEYPVPAFLPVTIFSSFGPERIGVFNGLLVGYFIRIGHVYPPSINEFYIGD